MEQGLNPNAVGVTSALTYIDSRNDVIAYAEGDEGGSQTTDGAPDWVEGS